MYLSSFYIVAYCYIITLFDVVTLFYVKLVEIIIYIILHYYLHILHNCYIMLCCCEKYVIKDLSI